MHSAHVANEVREAAADRYVVVALRWLLLPMIVSIMLRLMVEAFRLVRVDGLFDPMLPWAIYYVFSFVALPLVLLIWPCSLVASAIYAVRALRISESSTLNKKLQDRALAILLADGLLVGMAVCLLLADPGFMQGLMWGLIIG